MIIYFHITPITVQHSSNRILIPRQSQEARRIRRTRRREEKRRERRKRLSLRMLRTRLRKQKKQQRKPEKSLSKMQRRPNANWMCPIHLNYIHLTTHCKAISDINSRIRSANDKKQSMGSWPLGSTSKHGYPKNSCHEISLYFRSPNIKTAMEKEINAIVSVLTSFRTSLQEALDSSAQDRWFRWLHLSSLLVYTWNISWSIYIEIYIFW